MTIGKRLKALRTNLGITQEEIANTVGTTKQNIYKYENEIITNIPSDKIEILAEVLNTTPAYLMGWEKETAPVIPIEEYTNREKEHLKSYRRLFTADKDVVDKITNALLQTSYDMKSSP